MESKQGTVYPKVELSGIPERFKDKTIDQLVGYELQIAFAKQALTDGRGLFISGSCGSGKTHLACALMARYADWKSQTLVEGEVWERPTYRFEFLPAAEIFIRLRSSYQEQSRETEEDILRGYSNSFALVIDDLGSEKASDWARAAIYALIDRRYRDCRQTIITSNLTVKQLAQHIDDRLASRLLEMGEIINLNGRDFRQTMAKGKAHA